LKQHTANTLVVPKRRYGSSSSNFSLSGQHRLATALSMPPARDSLPRAG